MGSHTTELQLPYRVTTRKDFWKFAKTRINYREFDAHQLFLKEVLGRSRNNVTAASFTVRFHKNSDGVSIITCMEVSINCSCFPTPYEPLLGSAIEHEIYEMWVCVKPGIEIHEESARHKLAMRHEFRRAINDGSIYLRMQCGKRWSKHWGIPINPKEDIEVYDHLLKSNLAK